MAKQLLDSAERTARSGGFRAPLVGINLNRATLFFYLGDLASASKCCQVAYAIAEEDAGDRKRYACAVGGRGKDLMIRGHFEEALPWFEQSLTIFTEEGAYLHAAGIKSEIGCCHFGLNNHERAMPFFIDALRTDLESGAMPGYQINLANAGNVYFRRREFGEAITHYQKAVAIARELGDWISTAKWLRNLAATFSTMGSQKGADNFQREALIASAKVTEMRERAMHELSLSNSRA